MSRKHFIQIAASIKNHLDQTQGQDSYTAAAGESAIRRLAISLADDFGGFNSNFNRRRFLRACGIEEGL